MIDITFSMLLGKAKVKAKVWLVIEESDENTTHDEDDCAT